MYAYMVSTHVSIAKYMYVDTKNLLAKDYLVAAHNICTYIHTKADIDQTNVICVHGTVYSYYLLYYLADYTSCI